MGPMVVHAVLLALLSLPSPFQMLASGTVTGYIYDEETGQPLSAAIVTVVEVGMEVRTDRDGAFRIDFLTPGMYSVKVKHRGYMSHRADDVRVRSNRDAKLQIRMLKADDAFQLRRAQVPVKAGAIAIARGQVGTSDPFGAHVPRRDVLHQGVRAVRG